MSYYVKAGNSATDATAEELWEAITKTEAMEQAREWVEEYRWVELGDMEDWPA